jgi:signal transduction histidine kinase
LGDTLVDLIGRGGVVLAIAKGIVEANQGAIGVSSLSGKVTVFFFTLPGH